MRGIDCAPSQTLETLPWPWFREGIGVLKRKSIYLRNGSYINVVKVDFYYKQMCSRVLYLFGFSLNQGQGSVFTIRECAQSIPRIKLPLEGHLLKKIIFRKNAHVIYGCSCLVVPIVCYTNKFVCYNEALACSNETKF